MKIEPGEGKLQGVSPSRGKLLIGGIRGSSGKTFITLGVIGALKKKGVFVQPFKKGPDYIDAAWHALCSGVPCYCLDVYLMGSQTVARQFVKKSPQEGIAVIEGNRGLFDGVDLKGSYSTAEMAKLLKTPVLLVVDATKTTRTAAALVLGCQKLDPELRIGGVVLNQVAGERHQRVAREAIEDVTGVPVLGAVPKLRGISTPERHLGLVTPEETPDAKEWLLRFADEIEPYLDTEEIMRLALSSGEDLEVSENGGDSKSPARPGIRIGVIRDSAFPFYYPENLEALERAGAELVPVRAIDAESLPEVDALYLGGGFPETHAKELSENASFRESLRSAVDRGLPVYAECGGTVYLGRRLFYGGQSYEMAGILPVDFEFCERPQGHGYTIWSIDQDNPFYPKGTTVRGHEFHYTRAVDFDAGGVNTVARVERGEGFRGRREGIRVGNVVAFYGHIHVLGTKEWTEGILRAAENYAAGL